MIRSDSLSSLTPRRHRRTPEEREAQEQIKRRNDELTLLRDVSEILREAQNICAFLGKCGGEEDVRDVANGLGQRLANAVIIFDAGMRDLE